MILGRSFRVVLAALVSAVVFAAPAVADDEIHPVGPDGPAAAAGPSGEADAHVSGRAPYRLVGRKWPVRTVRVLDRSRGWTGKVLRQSIRQWNRSGARIKFRLVKRPGSRVVTVRTDKRLNGGKATAGYVRRGEVIPYPGPRPGSACKVSRRLPQSKFVRLVEKKCPWVSLIRMKRAGGIVWLQGMGAARGKEYFRIQVQITVHELGHIIGLGHRDTTCLVMNTKPTPGCGYSSRNPVKVMCRAPMPGDVLGAVRRYGGRVAVKKPRHNLCDKFRKPGRPGLRVNAEQDGLIGMLVKPGRIPPPFKPAKTGGRITVMVTPRSPCPYRRGGKVAPVLSGSYTLDSFWLPYDARKGGVIPRIVRHPAASFPGASLCVAAFIDDRFGRRSRLSAPVGLAVRG